MKYSDALLDHFYEPRQVGTFDLRDHHVGRAELGNYANGTIVHFQVKVTDGHLIAEARFRAYGAPPVIAACSYATEWVQQKSIEEALQLTSNEIMKALSIPPLKMHAALLVEDVVRAAIKDTQR